MFFQKPNYISAKKIKLTTLAGLILLFFSTNCTNPESLPTPPLLIPSVMNGQVYNLSNPGPIPIGWVPPPYETVSTVIAEDLQQNIRLEVDTDSHGKFQIKAPPGVYYLRIKESRLSSVTGPYQLKEGQILEVKAYYDNGMR